MTILYHGAMVRRLAFYIAKDMKGIYKISTTIF